MEELEENLRGHVIKLSQEIGERNLFRYKALELAANYITDEFAKYGYRPEAQVYEFEGRNFRNIIASQVGTNTPQEIVIVCAHYDSVYGSAGADDNASGVAGLLELARIFSNQIVRKTIKFIAFTNEEPPFFKSEMMGSRVYARSCKRVKDEIKSVICLETIGFYTQKKNSQSYPPGFSFFYPSTGNYIAVVGNFASKSLVDTIKQEFKKHSDFPVESLTTFGFIPGVDFSDHWSFWREGYPAVMITDTAFYRYPHYHSPTDTLEELDFKSMAQVIKGLAKVISSLSS